MSDRSLDEFVSGSPAGGDSDGDGDESHADPSVPTMRWSPDCVACDACGAAVSRRWNDGDDFVCTDCKEW